MNRPAIPIKLLPLVSYLESCGAGAEPAVLRRLLARLDITVADLADFVRFEENHYARNTVCEGPWFELLVVCWRRGQCSAVHDHHGSTCAFRVLQGECSETIFVLNGAGQPIPACTRRLASGSVVASAESDIHQVANLSPDGSDLVTLHIYSPPLRGLRKYASVLSDLHTVVAAGNASA